jgi:hypothetical protein
MFTDWQSIAVLLIILGALAYVGRRAWGRLRSFQASGKSKSACASGCGSCGDEQPATVKTKPQNVLVQITNSAGSATGRPRKP